MARTARDYWVEGPLPSGRWRGRFLTGEGRKHSGTFDFEWEAEDWAAAQARRVKELAGAPVELHSPAPSAQPAPPASAAPTLGAYADDYVTRREGLLVSSTVRAYRNAIRKFSDPRFAARGTKPLGRRPMDEITKADVERWITAQVAQLEGRPSINYRMTLLRSLYKDAERWGHPALGIRTLKVDLDEAVVLDRQERAALLAACTDDESALRLHRDRSRAGVRELAAAAGVSTGSVSAVLSGKPVGPTTAARVHAAAADLGYQPDSRGPDVELEAMVLVGLDCGLRWEEVAALPAGCLRGEFIKVRQVVERGQTIRRYTKGGEARNQPASARVRAALAALIASGQGRASNDGRGKQLLGSERLLFTTPTGRPLDYTGWRRWRFLPAVQRAGLDPLPTFHDLRHTYATGLARKGVYPTDIADLLGHADDSLVKRYVQASGEGRLRDVAFAALALIEEDAAA